MARKIELTEAAHVDNSDIHNILMTLNSSQRMFCELYVATRDVAGSYQQAYPDAAKASATSSGHRLMSKDNVKFYITYLIQQYAPVPRLSMPEIMLELEKVAMADDVSSYTKLKALTILGQSYGELTEKVEVTHKEFTIDIVDE